MSETKKILIIEDSDTLSELLSNQFVAEGFSVSIARDGDEGLKKILDERPNLVILDIVLPKKDGIAVLQELHSKEPDNKTPIIILSNSKDMDHIAGSMGHHVVAYLLKSDQDLEAIVTLVKKNIS